MSQKLNLIDRIIQNRLPSHILFWVGCLIMFTILAAFNSGNFKEDLISFMGLLPSWLSASYLLVYVQIPKFLNEKRYLLFMVSTIITIYCFSALARFSSIYFAEPFFRENFYQESLLEILSDPLHLAIKYFPNVYVVVFLMLIIKVFKDSFEEKHKLEMIQREKTDIELKYLKAQINPHFLFNTLNNLYSLTLTKSDIAPEVVVKLSDLLDYMLHHGNEKTVYFHKEVKLLQGYIDLERLRHGNKLSISFNHSLDDPSIKIAPLILLSFVENAFKHGANSIGSKININLEVKEEELYFKVFNSKSLKLNENSSTNKKQGIGFLNAKRQLELNYKDKYKLFVNESPHNYQVELKILLNQ